MTSPEVSRRPPAAGHVLEAGWLLAVTVVPLVFEPLAGSAFELPKAVVLRLIALAVAGAGLVSLVERLRSSGVTGPGWRVSPVVVAALVLTASTVVAVLRRLSPLMISSTVPPRSLMSLVYRLRTVPGSPRTDVRTRGGRRW